MPFTEDEKQQWHRERAAAAAQIESDRLRALSQARKLNAAAICLHCQNPFGLGEGIITGDAEMCYVCLD